MSFVIGLGSGQAFAGYHEVTHVFTLDDLVGGFDGRTYGAAGNYSDPSIVCGLAGSPACPAGDDGVQPMVDKQGNTLYPVDSDFGFIVTDFAGAVPKTRPSASDDDYLEGFAGTIYGEGDVPVGIALANVATDTFRVPAGLGTWCAGLGNTSVKCSAEQYVVMEHVKTCYETIPYMFADDRADPVNLTQAVLDFDGTDVFCADYKLDNIVKTIGTVYAEDGITVITPPDTQIESDKVLYDGIDEGDGVGYLLPNESTILDNIAASEDYGMTAKDDGKVLFRWGDLHKRPNDLRLYARMELPLEWKTPENMALNDGLGLRVSSALLSVDHVVTNNPNDQLRPEDMENEGAIGRKPTYVEETVLGVGLVSAIDCYEADSDFIPAGSVYKNAKYLATTLDPLAVPPDPYYWSSDLSGGWSNGWFTTVNREPFEWAYDSDVPPDGSADYSSPVPLETADTLISGPRWRMTAQKFGQTVPGLEIPIIECSEPPYQKDNIKYDVGAPITTVINLLDWNPKDERSVIVPALDPNGVPYPDAGAKVSPMEFTNGWLDALGETAGSNDGNVPNPEIALDEGAVGRIDAISVNGAPITEDFDLSVYVKGDKKATKVFDATLMVEYQDGVQPPTDVAAVSLVAPTVAGPTEPMTVTLTVNNPDADPVVADIEICGAGDLGYADCQGVVGTNLLSGDTPFNLGFTAPAVAGETITWTGTVSAVDDPNPANDSITDVTTDIVAAVDVAAVSMTHPSGRVRSVGPYDVTFTVTNVGPTLAPVVDAEVCATGTGYEDCSMVGTVNDLAPGASHTFEMQWTAPDVALLQVQFSATVSAAGDVDPFKDTKLGGTVQVRIPQ